eukprot:1391561-Amorphochlora_amoeboformis.AAC.3
MKVIPRSAEIRRAESCTKTDGKYAPSEPEVMDDKQIGNLLVRLSYSMRERTIHPLRTISDRREGTQLVGEVELAVHEPWPAPDIVFVVGLDARVRLGLCEKARLYPR